MILRHCRELIGCLVVHSCFVDACSANTTLANACDQAWNQVTGPSPCATGAFAFASEACVRLCRGSSLHVSLLLRCVASAPAWLSAQAGGFQNYQSHCQCSTHGSYWTGIAVRTAFLLSVTRCLRDFFLCSPRATAVSVGPRDFEATLLC